MDRKSILAIALSAIVLAFWQYQNQKELQRWQEQQKATAALTVASPTPSAQAVAPAAEPVTALATTGTSAPEPQVPEKTEKVSTVAADYVFTNLGGGIAQSILLKHEGATPESLMALNANAKHPIGAILPRPEGAANEPYTVTVKDGAVVAERTTPTGLRITKTFTLPEATKGADKYLVRMDVVFANKGAAPITQPNYFVYTGLASPIHKEDYPMYTGFGWSKNGKPTHIDVSWFDPGSFLGLFHTSAGHSQYEQAPGNVVWAGVNNQYFTSLVSVANAMGEVKGQAKGVWASPVSIKVEDKEMKAIQGALEMPGFTLAPGEVTAQSFTIFAGPKEYRYLKTLGHGVSEMMNFGWFKWISIGLLRSMNFLNDWIGSYAWAIIILTFIVRGALWPVQGAATRSMKKMQLLGPKMNELKEKYKDDPARMNKEVMGLYKTYGVNPFSGCLPMLIQIPIFFGFYSMLGTAVELRNSHFLWVADLSRPDTIGYLFGMPINILPIAMAVTMVIQMQMTPKTGDPMQQKIMMLMPLIFVVFTYNFASAWALYYTVQNILSIVQLYVTRDQDTPKLEKVAVASKKQRR